MCQPKGVIGLGWESAKGGEGWREGGMGLYMTATDVFNQAFESDFVGTNGQSYQQWQVCIHLCFRYNSTVLLSKHSLVRLQDGLIPFLELSELDRHAREKKRAQEAKAQKRFGSI